jgi:hypothetical protein
MSKAPSLANLEPTPERRRRSAFVVSPAVATESGPARAGSRVYRALSTVERLLRAGAIEPRQAQAADRLRDDFELGVAGAREPATGSVGATGWYYAEARLAALRRYKDAMKRLGPLAPCVLWIVLSDESLSALARKFSRFSRQEVAGVFKLGLSTLADHYGID